MIQRILDMWARFGDILVILLGFILTGVAVWYGFRIRELNKETATPVPHDSEGLSKAVNRRNLILARRWTIELGISFCALACFGAFKSDLRFPLSHIDGIILLMSIIGIIGALYALFARIDAEKAFHKAEQTYQKSQETLHKAQETLEALGNSFEFYEIFFQNRLPFILDGMNREDKTVSLFLGFPCVACFYHDRDKIPGKDQKIREMFYGFIHKMKQLVRDMQNERQKPYNFNLAVFSVKEINDTRDAGNFNFTYGVDELLLEFKRTLLTILEEREKHAHWKEKIKVHVIDKMKEKFRYAVVRDNDNPSGSKAIIWIIPDFPVEKNGFKSACFQSSDSNLIAMLENVFVRASDDSALLLPQLQA